MSPDGDTIPAHENPRDRRRRARARPLLVAPPKPRGRGDLLRAGQSRHRRGGGLPSGLGLGHRRDRGARREAPRRPDGRGARAAAVARHRGRVHQARAPDLRAHAPGGADRVVQGFLQGILLAAQHPDGRGDRLPVRRRGAKRAIKQYGFPVVLKADGLAGGKGVLIIESAEDAERALRLFFQERVFGAAGDRVIVEEFLRGQESSFLALFDGSDLRAAPDGPRLQEGLRRRPRAEHRRHGRALARGGLERRHGLAGAPGHPLADLPRPPGGGPGLPRRSLRRTDGHGVRPQGPRVQRPVRRSRNGSHPAARDLRHGRGHALGRPRRPRSLPAARGQERGLRRRRARGRRLSRRRTSTASRSRASPRLPGSRASRSSTPGPRATATAWSPRADASWS